MTSTFRVPLKAVRGNTLRQNATPSKSHPNLESDIAAITKDDSDAMTAQPGVYRRQSAAAHYGANQQQSLQIGDTVEVPGGMTGTVRYIGSVRGKQGDFAGVELNDEYAARGKNDGDVDGIRYFNTAIPGSGIFLPTTRATKAASDIIDDFSQLPTTPISRAPLKTRLDTPNVPNHRTPPTPSIPSFSQSLGPGASNPFSQSMGPGARNPSPQRLKSRPSLPRPASPTRKISGVQSMARPSVGNFRAPASPLPPRKPSTPAPARAQSRAASRLADRQPDDSTPTGPGRPSVGGRALSNNVLRNEETRRLQKEVEERDKQLQEQTRHLQEQAATLAQMETSLAELQSKSAMADAPNGGVTTKGINLAEVEELRWQVQEKNEKLSILTAEFDSHRSDFRDTIDALEAASTETERVYQQRIQELQEEVEGLQGNKADVEDMAEQFTQLEGMVQELEEGLDDARRSEAEARLKVEELEGQLERAQLELSQEKERGTIALKEVKTSTMSPPSNTKELQEKSDEIRGLKAIIQNLGATTSTKKVADTEELDRLRASLTTLQHQNTTLQTALSEKASREADLEEDNARLQASKQSLLRKTGTASSSNPHATQQPAPSSPTTAVRPFPRDPGALANFMQPATMLANRFRPSSTTNSSGDATLWCEICEEGGHDVLSCSRVSPHHMDAARYEERGEVETPAVETPPAWEGSDAEEEEAFDWLPSKRLSSSALPLTPTVPEMAPPVKEADKVEEVRLPLEGEDGPAPGKRSLRVDLDKWCAFCERDGHDSVDCPYEEEL